VPTPGIYIGKCLVKPKKYTCPVSVINTTDREVEIQTPFVTFEKVEYGHHSKDARCLNNYKPQADRSSSRMYLTIIKNITFEFRKETSY